MTSHWQPSVPWLADQEGRMVWWVISHWQPQLADQKGSMVVVGDLLLAASVPQLADREGKM